MRIAAGPAFLLATLLAASASATARAQDAAAPSPSDVKPHEEAEFFFRPRLEKGGKLRYRLEESQEMEGMTSGGVSKTTDLGVEVVSMHEDGGAELVVTFESVRGSLKGPTGEATHFDSREEVASGDAAPLDPRIAGDLAAAGKSFRVTLSPAGCVTAIRGLREILDLSAQVRMQGGATDDLARLRVHNLLPAQCPRPVAVGGEWKETLTLPLPGTAGVVVTFTQALAEATAAECRVTSKVKMELADSSGHGGVRLQDAAGEGTAVVSRKDGMPLSFVLESSQTMRFGESEAAPSMKIRTSTRLSRLAPKEKGGKEEAEPEDAGETPSSPTPR